MTVASDSCLQNPIIIQKILKHFSLEDDHEIPEYKRKPKRNLNLRLINKSFNSEILHKMRIAHRSIRLEFLKFEHPDFSPEYQVVINKIDVNEHSVKTDDIFVYLEFLSKIVNVKVEHFEMNNFWAPVLNEEWRKRLHNEIHKLLQNQPLKTFIGMGDLFDGFCNKCDHLAAASSHYGPLQTGISVGLSKNDTHVHFEKLVIGENYLHGTASNISMYLPVEDPKKFIDYYVDPLISCDQLCFKISGFFWISEQRLPTRPLPLEIIERMCDVWKVKSIWIEYNFWPQRAETWSDKGIITPFRFDELYQGTDSGSDKKKKKFSSVTIDLENSRNIYGEFTDGSIDRNDTYSNLIANVGRVFPTDNIIISCQQSPFYGEFVYFDQECFENILKSIWKNPGHLEVTIRHHAAHTHPSYDFVIPDSIDILDQRLNCTLLPERLTSLKYHFDFIGRILHITDQIGEKTLNLEVSFGVVWLKFYRKYRYDDEVTELANGLHKHFY